MILRILHINMDFYKLQYLRRLIFLNIEHLKSNDLLKVKNQVSLVVLIPYQMVDLYKKERGL